MIPSLAARLFRSRRPSARRRLALRPTPERIEDRVVPATFTWIGASAVNSNQWTDPGNWQGGLIPTSGFDTVIQFNGTGDQFDMLNDIPGLTVGEMDFLAGGYRLSGESIQLNIVNSAAGTNTIASRVGFATSSANIAAATGSTLVMSGGMTVDSTGLLINEGGDGNAGVDGGGAVVLDGVIDGSGGIEVAGTGPVTFAAANTYAGGTIGDDGSRIIATNASSFGSGSFSFSTLETTQAITFPNAFGVAAGGGVFQGNFPLTFTGSGSLQGPLNLNGNGANLAYVFSGAISGPGSITQLGGTVSLTGNSSYSGGTFLRAGTLTVQGNGLGTGTLNLQGGILTASPSAVTIANPVSLQQNSVINDAVGMTFTGSGSLSSTLTVNTSTITTFNGAFSGAGGFAKRGSGNLVLNGNSTLTGENLLTAGITVVNGSLGTGEVFLSAALWGNGTVGPITAIGPISIFPGFIATLGTLTSTGPVSLGPAASFIVDLSPIPGPGDQFKVNNGSLNLTGATLSVNPFGAIPVGRTFTIVSAPGGSISGTFQGLPNNASISSNGSTFQIQYLANSVVLKSVTAAQAVAGFDLSPYVATLKTGPATASADLNADGQSELIATRSTGKGRALRVLDGKTGRRLFDVRIPAGKARVATADVDGDGTLDIIVATGPANRPVLRVLNGRNGKLLRKFQAPKAQPAGRGR